MLTDYASELVHLAAVRQPREQPKDEDWRLVENELGYELPADFKHLVSGLGIGAFGCGLALHNPCASVGHARLSRDALILHRESIRDLEQSLGIALYPSPGGMVLVASMDRQDFYLCPAKASAECLTQLAWLDVDTEEIKLLSSTFSQFIHDLYLGLLPEPWAKDLRTYFWREGKVPLFSSTPRPSA